VLITTTDLKTDYEVLGLVRGNKTKARHVGMDILALLRNLVGGEVKEYSSLLREAREEAIAEMVAEAEKLGADAIVGVRLATSQIGSGIAEVIAYGTAVKL